MSDGPQLKLAERLSPRSKLLARRLLVGAVGACVRLAARAYRAGERLLGLAVAHGLDLDRAWDARPALRSFEPRPFGARDFLLLADAAPASPHAAVGAGESAGAGDSIEAGGGQTVTQAAGVTGRLAESPRASVILPAFGHVEQTFQCLRTLLGELDATDTEIIVVDDASRDETARLLAHLARAVRVVRNDEPLGLVGACGRGAEAARGRHLIFLEEGVLVAPGWLRGLVETAERDQSIGAVGSLVLGPDGRIVEAGSIVWRDGSLSAYGRGDSPGDRRYTFAREVDYCSGAALLVRRELFERLGGFNPRYSTRPYADADLCMGLRSLGSKIVYQPLARVTRDGARDTTVGGPQAQRRAADREQFGQKWGEALGREHLPPEIGDAERAANRRWDTQVAVFDDLIPRPDRDAGSARMMFILRALSEWAHPVFITTGKRLWPEYERLLWREGVETASAADYSRLLKRRDFRAVVLSRPGVAGFMMDLVRRAAPRQRIVYDMLDVHHLRATREAELTGDPRAAREAEELRRLETRLARGADLIWCGSSPDQELMARLAPGVPSAVVPTVHELHGRGLPFAAREHLLFVGNFSHRPNTDAVRFLGREVMPLVRRSLPSVELLVVGDNAPAEFADYAAEGVRLLGYVPDLGAVVDGCRVFVAPIRFGSGVNGKIGESLAYGLPVVTTTVGAEGWGVTDGEQLLIADAPADFAAAVVRLYDDAALWQKLSDGGYRHIAEHYTPELIRRVINDSLSGDGSTRPDTPTLDALRS